MGSRIEMGCGEDGDGDDFVSVIAMLLGVRT